MSIHGKWAISGLLVALLAGCQMLPYTAEEQGQAEDAAKTKEAADQAAQQKQQASRAAQQKAQAERVARQKALAAREAQQKAQQKAQADREAQAAREAQQEAQAAALEAQQKAQVEREAQQRQCLDSVTRLRDFLARWEDAEHRANAAPRFTLPPRITELRTLKQELEATSGSPCVDKPKADLVSSARLTEGYFQNFLINNRDYLAAEQAGAAEGKGDRQTAKRLMDGVKAELVRLDACKGTC